MTYRINFAVLRYLLEYQEQTLQTIQDMFQFLANMKIIGESDGDFVIAITELEEEMKVLLEEQVVIFQISTGYLRRFIEAAVLLLKPTNENNDVVFDADAMDRYMSDVEYEISAMATRI
ncbi:MAG: hypothetical protein FWG40_09615, partial [Peptococcaceae bacterium]|nr:hypothetical protein [Peptococcaceae bacterium]